MEKYCLKWNEFETNIRDSFRKLREDQRLFDVTLATDDGHLVQAHKMILSAGSMFFSDIFMKTDHKNMLIYLKGINRAELEQVADFLYNGEAFVAQEELNKFLETAHGLQVKGLQSDRKNSDDNFSGKNPFPSDALLRQSENIYSNVSDIVDQEGIADTFEDQVDTIDTWNAPLVKANDNNVAVSTNHELDLQIDQMIEKREGVWNCKVCAKQAASKQVIMNHSETHVVGVTHVCHICNKTASTRVSLKMHISNNHSDLVFSCDICGKSGMNKLARRNHKHNQ
jgi:hypothetical protein